MNESAGAAAGTASGAGDITGDAAVDAIAPRLRQFVVVAREQHLTRAAELLGVPQPTLSRSMSRLEAELGVALFDRPGRSIRLTRHGRVLLDAAERSMATLAATLDRITGESDPARGRVALGFLHTLGGEMVPGLLRDFRAERPLVQFGLVQDNAHGLLARLRAGEIDLCLTAPLPDGPQLRAHALTEQRIDLFVPVGHRFAGGAAFGSPRRRPRTSSSWSPGTACGRSPMSCAGPRASSRGSRSRARRRTRHAAWSARGSACHCSRSPGRR